jgi:UDP-glucose 4-epimerase
MEWLITGGAGFIGSHLTERLLRKGDRVVAIDDLSTGGVSNIASYREHPNFHFVADSVTNGPLLRELIDSADIVVHLAAAVGVRLIVESPVRTIETNVGATELVLAAAAKKSKRVLIASTSEVYGKGTKFPFSEEDDLLLGPSSKGRWSYAASKLIDEFLALAYWKEKKLPTTVVRLFNTVGPRQTGRYGMVIPTLARQALTGAPMTVYGTGQQSRCFAHVLDAVWGIEKLCRSDRTIGGIYNIGATEEISIMALAEKIRDTAHSSSAISLIPYSEAYEAGFEDMPRRVPDISKAASTIGFRVTRHLDDILRDVIAFERGRVDQGQTGGKSTPRIASASH